MCVCEPVGTHRLSLQSAITTFHCHGLPSILCCAVMETVILSSLNVSGVSWYNAVLQGHLVLLPASGLFSTLSPGLGSALV